MSQSASMRRALLAVGILATTACATAGRPVRQLDDNEVMVGASIAAPGLLVLPDLNVWARYAPVHQVDATLGVGVLALAPTALAEVRGHIPVGEETSLVLHGLVELRAPVGTMRSKQRMGGRALTSPKLAWTNEAVTVYGGPSFGYLHGFGEEPIPHSTTFPAFNDSSVGSLVYGAIFGAESRAGSWTLGGAFQLHVMQELRNPSVRPSVGLSGYVAF